MSPQQEPLSPASGIFLSHCPPDNFGGFHRDAAIEPKQFANEAVFLPPVRMIQGAKGGQVSCPAGGKLKGTPFLQGQSRALPGLQ